jgi:hypothetical protein
MKAAEEKVTDELYSGNFNSQWLVSYYAIHLHHPAYFLSH